MGSSFGKDDKAEAERRRKEEIERANGLTSTDVVQKMNTDKKAEFGLHTDLPSNPDINAVLRCTDDGSSVWNSALGCFVLGNFAGSEAPALVNVIADLQRDAPKTQDGKFQHGLLAHMAKKEVVDAVQEKHKVKIAIARLKNSNSKTEVDQVSAGTVINLVGAIKQALIGAFVPASLASAMAIPQYGAILDGVKACLHSDSRGSVLTSFDYLAGYTSPGFSNPTAEHEDTKNVDEGKVTCSHPDLQGRMDIWAYHAFEYDFHEVASTRVGWLKKERHLEMDMSVQQVVFHIVPQVDVGAELARGVKRRLGQDPQHAKRIKQQLDDVDKEYKNTIEGIKRAINDEVYDMQDPEEKKEVKRLRKEAFQKMEKDKKDIRS